MTPHIKGALPRICHRVSEAENASNSTPAHQHQPLQLHPPYFYYNKQVGDLNKTQRGLIMTLIRSHFGFIPGLHFLPSLPTDTRGLESLSRESRVSMGVAKQGGDSKSGTESTDSQFLPRAVYWYGLSRRLSESVGLMSVRMTTILGSDSAYHKMYCDFALISPFPSRKGLRLDSS
jgi:hypothetical protein